MTTLVSRMETIAESPLLPGRRPIALHVRDGGQGEPLVILHGGWGYGYYPYVDAIAALDRRFVIPDRTGYGRSPRVDGFPPRFHAAAAAETERLLDALRIERCALWGHSDGAVIATLLALRQPDRYRALIVEAIHLDREKLRSRAFFLQMANDPDAFGQRVTRKLAEEHGDPDWRAVLRADGQAWLDIAATRNEDLYDGRLRELRVPMLVLHGTDDPRTEPGELDRIARDVPSARIEMLEGGGHSPHNARGAAGRCVELVAGFLGSLG